jgi:phosphoglycolate phosphatase
MIINPKTIIFDFDGTLADSFWHNISLLTQLSLFKKTKLPSKDEIEALRNHTAQEVLALFNISKIKLLFYTWRIHRVLKNTSAQVNTFDDIKVTLQKLKELGYTLLILTSNAKETVANFMRQHNINYFDEIYSEKNFFGKDKALKKVIKTRNLNVADVYYVGDETRDIEACKKVGVKIIAVTWGYNTEQLLRKFNPDFIVNYPLDIIKLLQEGKV